MFDAKIDNAAEASEMTLLRLARARGPVKRSHPSAIESWCKVYEAFSCKIRSLNPLSRIKMVCNKRENTSSLWKLTKSLYNQTNLSLSNCVDLQFR